MRLVINRCYGGFSISKECAKRMAELGCKQAVEIPDGIEWELDEYDGLESVHECHRSWS